MKITRILLTIACCVCTMALYSQGGRGKKGNKGKTNNMSRILAGKEQAGETAASTGTVKVGPDSNYFQQKVDFNISVKLNDVDHTLKGFETVTYKNNSPHTLKYIYFHIWPNAYKNTKTQLAKQLLESGDVDFYFAPESERGYIDSLLFKAGNDTLKWEYYKVKKTEEEQAKDKEKGKKPEEYIDIVKVTLKKPLLPDSTVVITTPFFVKIPSGLFSRLGHVGQSYQITQWFPKPAVYDKKGWNPMPYLNQGEFYSEYGDFDVSITVPANYLVAATGELTGCPQEERMLELKAKETEESFRDHKTNKLGNLLGSDAFPASSAEWKTLRYVQKNVHDFAWFADKRWHVLKGEYVFEKSGKLVSLWSFFTTGNSRYWRSSIQYIHDAVHYYSKWNGDYPYNIVTAVDGTISAGGGMEYPTITNIGEVGSAITLETVIMHEVGHNWFYGILGSNEREHPWMDEGLNSANEMRYLSTKYPEMTVGTANGLGSGVQRFLGIDSLKSRMSYYLGSKFPTLTNDDQPIEGKAAEFTDGNYALMVYYKTAAAFNYLRVYLGDRVYDQCMHAYFDAWKFKHPQPNDLRKVFEKVAKKDLSWFFEELINTNKVIDYKIVRKRKPNTGSTKTFGWMVYEEGIEVKNKGSLYAPFCVVGITYDTVNTVRWYPGFKGREVVPFPNGNYDKVVIDPFYDMPEINQRNNTLRYKIKGQRFLQRFEKPKFKFLLGVDDPKRSMLYWTPVAGANVYDGFQAGLALYNAIGFQKPFEYTLMPLYGFGSKKLNGSFSLTAHSNYRNSTWLKSADLGVNGVNYSDVNEVIGIYTNTRRFFRVAPFLRLNFKPKTARSPLTQNVVLRYHFVNEHSRIDCDCDSGQVTFTGDRYNHFADLGYRLNHGATLMPQRLEVNLRYGAPQGYGDFAWTTVEYTVSRILGPRKKRITARAYFGAFLFSNTVNSRYNLRGDGIRGQYDYTYSETFIGRTEVTGFWSQQFAEGYGNIKAPTAYAQSNKWNAAVNLNCDLPIPVFKLFADAGVGPFTTYTYPAAGAPYPVTSTRVVADAGIYASLLNGVLNVYLPVWVSGDIQREYDANGTGFGERVRFSLNIQPFTPQRIAKTIKLF